MAEPTELQRLINEHLYNAGIPLPPEKKRMAQKMIDSIPDGIPGVTEECTLCRINFGIYHSIQESQIKPAMATENICREHAERLINLDPLYYVKKS